MATKIESVINNIASKGITLPELHRTIDSAKLDQTLSVSLDSFDNFTDETLGEIIESSTQKTMNTIVQKWEKLSIAESYDHNKSVCREVLGLDESLDNYWDMIDSYSMENNTFIILCHYNKNVDFMRKSHQSLANVRGVIVDVPNKKVVSFMSGYNEDLEVDGMITEVTDDGVTHYEVETTVEKFYNTEADGDAEQAKVTYGTRKFSDKAKFYVAYEPVVVRFFKWNGRVFFSTHKRLVCNHTSWGDGTNANFETILTELGGERFLSGESLFGVEENSPYTHSFMMVHAGTRLVSAFNESRLFYIGVTGRGFNSVTFGEIQSEYETSPKIPELSTEPEDYTIGDIKPLIMHKNISVEMCNKILFPNQLAIDTEEDDEKVFELNEMRIVYDDNHVPVDVVCKKSNFVDASLQAGDSVVVIDWDASTQQTRMFKLVGVSYRHRSLITMNNPNLYSQYVRGIQSAIKASESEFKTSFPLYSDDDGDSVNYGNVHVRKDIYNYVFELSVSSSRKDQVRTFATRFTQDINRTADKILRNTQSLIDNIRNKNTINRISDIANRSNGQTKTARGLLYNETGAGLYKIISEVKKVD